MNQVNLNIIAIGGGRIYAGETRNIDNYTCSLLPEENKSITILPTASRDRADYIKAIKKEYKNLGIKVNIIYENKLMGKKFSEILLNSSGLYIGGGDLSYLIEALEKTDSVEIIKKYIRNGKVAVGLSAGAALFFERVIFFEEGKYLSTEGFGILNGIVIPHFTQDILEKCKNLIIEFGPGKNVYGISDGAALHFIAEGNYRVITEPYSAGVWKVSVSSDNISQEKL